MHTASVKLLKSYTRAALYSAAIFLSSSFYCNAEVYKWTDKNGNTHYSDIKPNDINSEKLRIKTKTATQTRTPPQTSANELDQRNEKALKEKSEQLKASTEKRELDARCEAIRSNLKTLEVNSRIQVQENGETRL